MMVCSGRLRRLPCVSAPALPRRHPPVFSRFSTILLLFFLFFDCLPLRLRSPFFFGQNFGPSGTVASVGGTRRGGLRSGDGSGVPDPAACPRRRWSGRPAVILLQTVRGRLPHGLRTYTGWEPSWLQPVRGIIRTRARMWQRCRQRLGRPRTRERSRAALPSSIALLWRLSETAEPVHAYIIKILSSFPYCTVHV